MITSLSIENFALIEKLSVHFPGGFSTITGETGAGKSILLGALGLVLGKRADLSSLKNKEEKCVIEAQFNIKNYHLQPFFTENDLDYEDATIIRREILPSGKSRAFVNDTPVNLQQLQDLSDYLIDIHSQNQTRELSDDRMQFQIIDSIGGNADLISQYAQQLKAYKSAKSALNTKRETLQLALKEQDYNTFLLEELLSANLKTEEQQTLEAQFETLNNVEAIQENVQKSSALLGDEQFGVLDRLKEIRQAMQKNAGFSGDFEPLYERVSSLVIEADDIEKELQLLSEKLLFNPEEHERIGQKLQLIYNLQKKHGVDSIAGLIEIQNDLDGKVISVGTLESEIEKLEKTISESETTLDAVALNIHGKRAAAIPQLSEKLTAILSQLGMPNARFNITLKPSEAYLQNGKDELEFLFSANKGADFGLLKKVASGGEMSRIMLAVKAILSQYSKLPSIIFDEIDTGVSGEIAHKMAEIMNEMSHNMQVMAITHLPQIAAKGQAQFKVYKFTKDNQTVSELKLLNPEQRITEIAQMLSGAAISESALNHAKALLN